MLEGDEFDPVALHRRNIQELSDADVIVPAYPGSGHAYLGNILLELGLNYSDPYTERFLGDGAAEAVPERLEYRRRFAAERRSAFRTSPRFVKTHLYPSAFHAPVRVALLVRDPRDAIYSYYRWRLGFSEEGEGGSFEEFLARKGFNGMQPCEDWAKFNIQWHRTVSAGADVIVLRFEEIKSGKLESLVRLLSAFAPQLDLRDIAPAVDASSFSRMRAHEDNVAPPTGAARIMRRGLVGEWREWYDASPAKAYFQNEHLRAAAELFGYGEWGCGADQ